MRTLRIFFLLCMVIAFTGCSNNNVDPVTTLTPSNDVDPITTRMPSLICSESSFPSALKTQITQSLSTQFPLVPGAVIAIYHPSHGYVVMTYGLSNTSSSTAMSADSIFDIGSVHKLFKWVLLERLVDQGRLNFNDNINTYIDNPIINGGKFFNLANHSTGMVDIDESVYNDIWSRTDRGKSTFEYTYSEMMSFLANEDGAGFLKTFTLGTNYNYSSYGPVLAGEIAENIVGEPFNEQIHEQIIDELGMSSTTFHGYDPRPTTVTLGYGNDYAFPVDVAGEHPQPNQNLMLATSSAVKGAIFSTACDMTYFARAISDSSLNFITPGTIDSRTATSNDFNSYLKVGRGVMNYYSQNTGNFWVHAGDGAHGHSSVVGYNPTNGVSVAILTNFNPYFMDLNYGEYAAQFKILELLDAYY